MGENTANTINALSAGAAIAGGPIGLGIGAALQLGLGIYQTVQARKGLKELERTPRSTYDTSIARAEYNKALSRSSRGYTAQEMAAARTGINRSQNLALRRATDLSGGSLSNAIGATLSSQRTSAYNQLAMQDAQLHRQNIADARNAGYGLQGQFNMQTGADLGYRNMMEQGYGAAQTQGINNMVNAGTRFSHYYPFKGSQPQKPKMSTPGDRPYNAPMDSTFDPTWNPNWGTPEYRKPAQGLNPPTDSYTEDPYDYLNNLYY